jgi:hypothetical protein
MRRFGIVCAGQERPQGPQQRALRHPKLRHPLQNEAAARKMDLGFPKNNRNGFVEADTPGSR